jgi:hypothetical protein
MTLWDNRTFYLYSNGWDLKKPKPIKRSSPFYLLPAKIIELNQFAFRWIKAGACSETPLHYFSLIVWPGKSCALVDRLLSRASFLSLMA